MPIMLNYFLKYIDTSYMNRNQKLTFLFMDEAKPIVLNFTPPPKKNALFAEFSRLYILH